MRAAPYDRVLKERCKNKARTVGAFSLKATCFKGEGIGQFFCDGSKLKKKKRLDSFFFFFDVLLKGGISIKFHSHISGSRFNYNI